LYFVVCFIVVARRTGGRGGAGGEEGTDGGVPMGYDYSVSGNIAKITLLICFEKRGSEGEEGVEQAAKPYVSGGGEGGKIGARQPSVNRKPRHRKETDLYLRSP
jgi:hypothetical protein